MPENPQAEINLAERIAKKVHLQVRALNSRERAKLCLDYAERKAKDERLPEEARDAWSAVSTLFAARCAKLSIDEFAESVKNPPKPTEATDGVESASD